jgi:S-adenosylmethionine-dependent methyltransferase
MSDTDFDGRAEAFEADIYGTSKGYVRLNVLWQDLLSAVSAIGDGGLSVLDAGGGSGHLAVRLAALGNRVTLCDPSAEMLAMASKRAEEEGVADRVVTVRSDIQGLAGVIDERFDLVTCHAVLEWLGEPEVALRDLAPFLKPDGLLSLMFYNRNAAVLKRVLRGDFRHDPPPGPPFPLDEADVRDWLAGAGLRVVSKAGVRIFHDLLDPAVVQADPERLLEIETEMRRREPFASLAQHIHLVCERAQG